MTFKAKLRRIGNSQGVYIPKDVITGYNIGDVITLSLGEEVITPDLVITKKGLVPDKVITEKKPFNTVLCKKHEGSMKGTCGCK